MQERKLRRFGVGGSYSTLDGLGLEAYWLHRNLFGRAERLRFDAKVAGIGETFEPDELTYRLGATFIKPGIYTPDTDFVASIFGDREVLDPYTRTAVTGQLGFNHMFSEELSAKAFLNGGYAEFEDDMFGTREFTHIGFLGGLTFDNRDNKTDATEGYFLEATAEPFYEFEYGNAVGKFTAEGRAYYGFGKDNPLVVAGRVKIGTLFGSPISETAPDKLFFAGGGGSVRGYAYRNIGVVTPAGEVIGGRSLIEGSAELRYRVTEGIGLVAFVDAGYVGDESIPRLCRGSAHRRRRRPALLYGPRPDQARCRRAARSAARRSERGFLCRNRTGVLTRILFALALLFIRRRCLHPRRIRSRKTVPISSALSKTSCRRRTVRSESPASRAYCRLMRQSARSPSPTAKASGCASPTRASCGRAPPCCSAGSISRRSPPTASRCCASPLPEEGLPPPEAGSVPDPGAAAVGHAWQSRRAARQLRRRGFGLASEIAVKGRLQLAEGSLDTALDVTRLDGPGGKLALTATYANSTQNLNLDFSLGGARRRHRRQPARHRWTSAGDAGAQGIRTAFRSRSRR